MDDPASWRREIPKGLAIGEKPMRLNL